jgi:hypothetical protein
MATKEKELEKAIEVLKNRVGFGLAVSDDIVIPATAYSVRNNCQVGQWMKGDGITPLGPKLSFSPIYVVPFYGDLGKSKATHWLQVWGVSEQILNGKSVFVTYIKGQNQSSFGNLILEATLEGKQPQNVIIHSSFIQKSNEYGTYYTLHFELAERAEDDPMQEKIMMLIAGQPHLVDNNIPITLFPVEGVESLEEELDLRRTLAGKG